VSQKPEQHGTPASFPQASPLGKHADDPAAHRPRRHEFEQQSLLFQHGVPKVPQSAVPHTPALQPSEQHDCAWVQRAPSARQ
jgi:hypothetical protein